MAIVRSDHRGAAARNRLWVRHRRVAELAGV